MFLTRFTMNAARRGTKNLVASPQRMHAAVLSSYHPSSDPGRVLWRLDRNSTHDLQLYLVGAAKPDLTHLVEQAGWPTTESWQTADYVPFLRRLEAGQRWRFRLTANPVRAVRRPDNPAQRSRGRVSPEVTVMQQAEWLRNRSEDWGFRLPADANGFPGVSVTSRAQDAFSRRDLETRDLRDSRVTITRVQFDGLLEVSDPERLREALAAGMGRAKAYGCGLMTLASAR